MNARDRDTKDTLIARNRERFDELVRCGMTAEELYRLVVDEGGSRADALVAVRDRFGVDAMGSIAVETLATEDRSAKANEDRSAEAVEEPAATPAESDNPYAPPRTSSVRPSPTAARHRLPVWLRVGHVVANVAAIAVIGLLALVALWFLVRLSR